MNRKGQNGGKKRDSNGIKEGILLTEDRMKKRRDVTRIKEKNGRGIRGEEKGDE